MRSSWSEGQGLLAQNQEWNDLERYLYKVYLQEKKWFLNHPYSAAGIILVRDCTNQVLPGLQPAGLTF